MPPPYSHTEKSGKFIDKHHLNDTLYDSTNKTIMEQLKITEIEPITFCKYVLTSPQIASCPVHCDSRIETNNKRINLAVAYIDKNNETLDRIYGKGKKVWRRPLLLSQCHKCASWGLSDITRISLHWRYYEDPADSPKTKWESPDGHYIAPNFSYDLWHLFDMFHEPPKIMSKMPTPWNLDLKKSSTYTNLLLTIQLQDYEDKDGNIKPRYQRLVKTFFQLLIAYHFYRQKFDHRHKDATNKDIYSMEELELFDKISIAEADEDYILKESLEKELKGLLEINRNTRLELQRKKKEWNSE